MPDRPVKTRLKEDTLYLEPPELGGSMRTCFAIDRVLESRRTEFQQLDMVEAGDLGRMLLLDGVPQTCTFDEAAYHEMITHVPLLTHPAPRRVLVIGGGDGGVVREALKHPGVHSVELCEIDGQVIETSRRYLPELAEGLDDPRVEVLLADATELIRRRHSTYDVIIVDSSDPIGPAVELFAPDFYAELRSALRPGGVVCSQSESFYLYGDLISGMFEFLPELFDRAHYYYSLVPTYVSGVIGFAICTLGPDPLAPPDEMRAAALGDMEYYTPAAHRAAFALPRLALRLLPDEIADLQQSL